MANEYDPGISLSGSGDAVVLVSGMDGTGRLFYRQVPLLARTWRVATYALRDDARDMEVLVDDLATVVDAAAPRLRRALIVGESFGGAIALSFALTYPERVAGVVILNSFPFFAPQFRLRLAETVLRLMPWGAMKLVRQLTAFRLHSRYTHREDMARFMELTALATRRGYLNRLHILRTYDVRRRLSELPVPVLFLAADEDHLVPAVRQAQLMAAAVPGATMRTLSGHGHICLIARNLDLGTIVDEWWADLATAPGNGRPTSSARQAAESSSVLPGARSDVPQPSTNLVGVGVARIK